MTRQTAAARGNQKSPLKGEMQMIHSLHSELLCDYIETTFHFCVGCANVLCRMHWRRSKIKDEFNWSSMTEKTETNCKPANQEAAQRNLTPDLLSRHRRQCRSPASNRSCCKEQGGDGENSAIKSNEFQS